MNPNYCDTITLYNKLDSADSADGKEHWIKTVLENVSYNSRESASQGGNQMSLTWQNRSTSYTVRIPETADYHPYHEWKENLNGFTLRPGDVVVKGICEEDLDPVANNPAKFLNRMKPEAFHITNFSDNTKHIMDKHYRIGG